MVFALSTVPCLLACLLAYPADALRSQRVDAAKARIESLNPLVAVETISDPSALEDNALQTLLAGVDMVCVTDMDRTSLVRFLVLLWSISGCVVMYADRGRECRLFQVRLNDTCRRLNTPFYAGGTYGLLGYIFCDLLQHDYIAPYVLLLL